MCGVNHSKMKVTSFFNINLLRKMAKVRISTKSLAELPAVMGSFMITHNGRKTESFVAVSIVGRYKDETFDKVLDLNENFRPAELAFPVRWAQIVERNTTTFPDGYVEEIYFVSIYK